MTTRPRNPRGEGSKLREQLLAATAEVLNEVGDADRASVRAIAARAGVSPTALYLQFPDRDALIAAAVDAGFETFNRELLTAASIDGPPVERLMNMGRAYLAFYEERPALYATLFSTRRTAVDKDPDVNRDQALDGVVALLQAMNPSLGYEPACELAILIWSSLHGYAMLRAVRPHLEWPDAEVFLRRLLTAYAPS
ncbi:TetR/AcrR family transcriptional regulator [Solirubrobacter soli]|uniref:TetR/AcrR family transcriptional regulator n=1 Tax=Solirubrobacter soli TaxID=363832 RepID=UPI00040AD7C1|nr:TetR/AcrR family transcriptional regulator [Solirubrobacter soli]